MEKAAQTSGHKWYALPIDAIKEHLATDFKKGLSTEKVSERREKFGKNEIPQAKKQSELMRFLL